MDTFREIIGWLVAGSGFVCWVAFVPQIRLLVKIKRSESNSLGLMWISFVMQVITLLYLLIQPKIDWRLVSVYTMSLIGLIVITVLIYYYRRFPGGRNKS